MLCWWHACSNLIRGIKGVEGAGHFLPMPAPPPSQKMESILHRAISLCCRNWKQSYYHKTWQPSSRVARPHFCNPTAQTSKQASTRFFYLFIFTLFFFFCQRDIYFHLKNTELSPILQIWDFIVSQHKPKLERLPPALEIGFWILNNWSPCNGQFCFTQGIWKLTTWFRSKTSLPCVCL